MSRDQRFGYELDQEQGQLFFHSQGDRRICGDINLTLCWTSDEGMACLHKHGSEDLVEKYAERLRPVDESVQMMTIPWASLMHPEAGPAIIEEVNKCLEISGYVGGLEERVRKVTEDLTATDDMMIPS